MPHKSLKFSHGHGSYVLPGSDGDDSDAEYVPSREKCKLVQKVLKHGRTQNKSAVDFLHQYHDGTHLSSKSKGDNPFPCAKQINRQRRKRGRDDFSTSRYEGSLHLVQFTLILLAEADNAHLRTDILGLGRSLVDKTPGVWHSGVHKPVATKLKLKLGGRHLMKIPEEYWKTPVCIASKAPEDPSKSRL